MPAAPARSSGRTRMSQVTGPLQPRHQVFQDAAVSLGPVTGLLDLAIVPRSGHVILRAWSLGPAALAAVGLWHLTAHPAPPASWAPRGLACATAAVTLLTAVAATVLVLASRSNSVTWWNLLASGWSAGALLLAAAGARPRLHPGPRAAQA